MEKTLQKIANLLIINMQNIISLGLLNGKMGTAVFLYHYFRYASQPVYSDQADDLLDELFTSLNMNVSPSLADGVAGIGLGLIYLIKNHFVESDENPDELFKDTDFRLSQNIYEQFSIDIKTNFPIFSAGFYALSRIKTGNRTTQKNKLISSLLKGITVIYTSKQLVPNPMFTNSVIYFLSEIYNHGMYKEYIKKALKTVLVFILDHASTTNYYLADINILHHLLSSIEVNVESANKILAQINQFNISPENKTNTDVVCRNLQQYILYPYLDNPDFLTLPMEKYVDDYIAESTQSGLSLLPYIGLNMMGVKLC
jgi:hypothetical protein